MKVTQLRDVQQASTHPRTQEHRELQLHQQFAPHTDLSCSLHKATNHILYWIGSAKTMVPKKAQKCRNTGTRGRRVWTSPCWDKGGGVSFVPRLTHVRVACACVRRGGLSCQRLFPAAVLSITPGNTGLPQAVPTLHLPNLPPQDTPTPSPRVHFPGKVRGGKRTKGQGKPAICPPPPLTAPRFPVHSLSTKHGFSRRGGCAVGWIFFDVNVLVVIRAPIRLGHSSLHWCQSAYIVIHNDCTNNQQPAA